MKNFLNKHPEDKINFSKTAIQPSNELMNRKKKVFDETVANMVNQRKRVDMEFMYLEIMKFIRYNELRNIKDFIDKYTVNLSYNANDAHKIFIFDQNTVKIKPMISITIEVRKRYQRKQYNVMKFVDWYKDNNL